MAIVYGVSRSILAGLIFGAGVTKFVYRSNIIEEFAQLVRLLGWSAAIDEPAINLIVIAVGSIEVLIGLGLVAQRTRVLSACAILLLVVAGSLFYGSATSWGRVTNVPCACGLPLPASADVDNMTMLLFRQAVLFALLALSCRRQGDGST